MRDKSQSVVIHGIPGEGARAKGICAAILPLLFCVFLFGVFSGLLIPYEATTLVLVGFIGVFIVVLWLAWDFYNGVASYFKGARGEEIVAVQLGELPVGYHVFHDLEISGVTPIDHLVIGPAGVFVVETKFWSGRVHCRDDLLLVDGMEPTRSPVDQVNVEVKALSAWLTKKMSDVPNVTPIVCFAGNTFERSSGDAVCRISGVDICNVDALNDLILAGGANLTSVEVERFVKLMEY